MGLLSGAPIATADGSAAVAQSTKGGKAVAISNGKGAKAHAVSTGGYAESVAVGNGAQSNAAAGQGVADIDRTVVGADGQAKNQHFNSSKEAQKEIEPHPAKKTASTAVADGSGAVAQSTKGGKAVAISSGKGAKAHAVSTGGYSEAVALGNGAQSNAAAGQGAVDIDRTVVGADGQAKNQHFTSPQEKEKSTL